MEQIDLNGQTESEFLAAYRQKNYPRPSLTADIVVLVDDGHDVMRILLIRRGRHPYLGCWALPGGFVEEGESADSAAIRELEEETGVIGAVLEQLAVYSTPGRDPRAWTVSGAFLLVLDEMPDLQAGDDAADARWFFIDASQESDELKDGSAATRYVLVLSSGQDKATVTFSKMPQRFCSSRACEVVSEGLAFDHAQIIADAYLRLSSSGQPEA